MYLKRVEIEKKFSSKDEAMGFAAGVEFVGAREYKVKQVIEETKYTIVVLEKLEKSKT